MAIGIIAGLGALLLGLWQGIKGVSVFIKDTAILTFNFFKSIISWIIATAPKPVTFVLFIFLILLFGNLASSFLLGIKYTCDDTDLREYTNIGFGSIIFFVDMVSSNEEVNESNVCTANGSIEPHILWFQQDGVTFTYDETDIYFSSVCNNSDYCTKEGDSFKTITCNNACINFTDNDGEVYKSCPEGTFDIEQKRIDESTPVGDFSDKSYDIFQVYCSGSGNPRFKVFEIDWLSFELWALILLMFIAVMLFKGGH